MNRMIRILAVLLSAILILGSCTGAAEPVKKDQPAANPASSDINIVADGATMYKLVRPQAASSELTAAVVKLRKAINAKYGIEIEITDDFVLPGQEAYAYEILVGDTEREESKTAVVELSYNDSVIAYIGNRLVISGGSEDAAILATEAFIENYLTDGALTVSSTLSDITKAEYEKADLTIDGTPISAYVIVYSPAHANAARKVAAKIGKLTGVELPLCPEGSSSAAHEIVIGKTMYGTELEKYGLDDFTIDATNRGIQIKASNKTAVEMACAEFCKMLGESNKLAYTLSEFAYAYTHPADRSYIDDIESLPMHWALEFETPEWMRDYEEKYAATNDAGGRLMSCAHRGDSVYYPDNSIEGIISAIKMGCDMIEIDPRRTKDGVLIIFHDETLTRMTNFSEMAGKNGLPTSANVSDWTYEQLMQLNLKASKGGSGAAVTPYKIATLEEVIKVCANRIFIYLDAKTPADSDIPYWDFEQDIWPLMEKYESYSNVVYSSHKWFRANNYALVDTYRAIALERSGKAGIVYIIDTGTLSGNNSIINAHDFTPFVRFGFSEVGEDYKKYLSSVKNKLNAYKGKLRMLSFVYNAQCESHDFYAEVYEAGINYHIVNKALLLCTYIAENFEPTPYAVSPTVAPTGLRKDMGTSDKMAISTLVSIVQKKTADPQPTVKQEKDASAVDIWDGTIATSFESGSGSEAFPYVIKTGAQLAYLAQQVSVGGNSFAGKHFVLGGNIDLAKLEWTPIGVYSSTNRISFAGSFDGKGYTISGISITNDNASIYSGLFGFIKTEGYFRNLVIADSTINAQSKNKSAYAGAAAAYIEAAEVSSIVVKEDVMVSSNDSTGGVFGRIYNSDVRYIVNYATVIGNALATSSFAGGISGPIGRNATISYSANHGKVSGDAMYLGGITSIVGAGGGGNLINCYNDGAVEYTGKSNAFVAGVTGRLGWSDGDYTVKDCCNLGALSKPNSGANALKRIGEVTGQSYKGNVTLTDVYSIDIANVELLFANTTKSDLTTVQTKSEAEVRALADAIDKEISANIVTPTASAVIDDLVITETGSLADAYFVDALGDKLNYKVYLPENFVDDKKCKVIFNFSSSTEIIDALIQNKTNAAIFSCGGSTGDALELIDLAVTAYALNTNFMYLIGSAEVNAARGDDFVNYLADASGYTSPLAAGEALLAVSGTYYSELEGLTMYAMGDSYFAGHFLGQSITWVNKLGEKYDMHYVNYGINGSTMSDYDSNKNPMVTRIKDMERGDANIILLEGGRNDLTTKVPLGSSGSRDTKTFTGAVNTMVDYLREAYPNAMIVLVTPWIGTGTLDNGYSNKTYADILRSIAEERKDPHVVCLYADSARTGISMGDAACRAQYFIAPSDLSHLNEAGMDMVLPKMEKFIAEAYTGFLHTQTAAETNGGN